MPKKPDNLLSVREAAAIRDVTTQCVYRWIFTRQLPCEVDRWGRRFVDRATLEAFMPRNPGRAKK